MKTVFALIILIASSSATYGQIKAQTEAGSEVILYQDGTWELIKKGDQDAIEDQPPTEYQPVESRSKAYATFEIDEFTKSKKISTGEWLRFGVDKAGRFINGQLRTVNDVTVFTITYSGDLGCFSQYSSEMKVKLTSGEIITLTQLSSTECGEYESVDFIPLTPDQMKLDEFDDIISENLEILKGHEWETIRLRGTEFYADLTPHPTEKNRDPEFFFKEHIIAAEEFK